ncbi:hypothetical protein RC62_2896 [Flavobacterium aquidurense]|uniref:Uncharacterized protein n=2 Tax=Flavobacterium aquidurense TaxID=362413 RepID=A0A0Q0S2W4_9FLAO|nr:hypothetical protein RC62_2896 [Flavobacterium aquidurense]
MSIRLNLIADLKSFPQKSHNQYNLDKTVDRNNYFDLMKRVNLLKKEDFESEEKYKYFLNFIKQPQNQADRYVFEINFTENHLEIHLFLWMVSYVSRLTDWLK